MSTNIMIAGRRCKAPFETEVGVQVYALSAQEVATPCKDFPRAGSRLDRILCRALRVSLTVGVSGVSGDAHVALRICSSKNLAALAT